MSAWIRPESGAAVTAGQGQVAVSGTWLSNLVREGFALIAPASGGPTYEITGVSTSGSSTVLTIDRPYAGTTDTAAAIAIIPLYSTDSEAASAFATLLTKWMNPLGQIYRASGDSRELVLRRLIGTADAGVVLGTDTEDSFRLGVFSDTTFRIQRRQSDGVTWEDIFTAAATSGDVNFAGLAALLAGKAPTASPEFTGVPKAPTPSADANNNQIANTAWVAAQITAHNTDIAADIADLTTAVTGKQTSTAATGALAALTPAAGKIPRFTGAAGADLMTVTDFGAGLVASADDAAGRAALGAQAASPLLTALAGVTTSQDRLVYATGVEAFATTILSSWGRSLIDDADAAAGRATLDAQQHGAALDALRGLTPAGGKIPVFSSSTTSTLWDAAATGQALLATATQADARAALGVVGKASKRNRFANPAFQVCQDRATGATITISSSSYAFDGVAIYASGGGALTAAQVLKDSPGGSPYRFRASVAPADTALAAGDFYAIVFPIDGDDVSDLAFGTVNARPFVFSAAANFPAGTYCASFSNADRTRSYVVERTIASGGTDSTLGPITVAGDTSGTWVRDASGVGMYVSICLASGTTRRTATTGAWQNGNYACTAAQTNGMASTSNVFELADIGFYSGTELPEWEMPDSHADLRAAQKYYWRSTRTITIQGNAAFVGHGMQETVYFPRRMRATPACSYAEGGSSGVNSIAAANPSVDGFQLTVASNTTGNFYILVNSLIANARLPLA